MRDHVKMVAVLHIVLASFGLLGAMFVFTLLAGSGIVSGDPEAVWITSLVASFVGAFLAGTALPGLVGGIGLLRHQGWARIVILIVSAFYLFHVPLGTLIAIYSFWVLLKEDTAALFRDGGSAAVATGGGPGTAVRPADAGESAPQEPQGPQG